MFVLFIWPLSTNVGLRRWPWMNLGFFAANLGTYLLLLFQRGSLFLPEGIASQYGLNPQFFELHQLITSLFLHAGPGHLLVNLIFLWVFGNPLNDRLGQFWYFVYYLAGGILAGFGFLLLQGQFAPAIGASGAIAAVVGGYFVLFSRSEIKIFILLWGRFNKIHWVDSTAVIIFYVLLDVLRIITGSGGVAWSAHITGYLVGGVGTYYLARYEVISVDEYSFLSD